MNKKNISQQKESIQGLEHVWVIIVTVIVTTVVVGGGVYILQRSAIQPLKSTIFDLQSQIEVLEKSAQSDKILLETTQEQKNIIVTEEASDLKTYSNEDLGIQFKYPANFLVTYEQLTDYEAGEHQENLYATGKDYLITFEEDCGVDSCTHISLRAITKDYKNFFFENPFDGGELNKYCHNSTILHDYIIFDNTICEIRQIGNKEYVFGSLYNSPECSPHFTTEFSFNNPNLASQFTWLSFSVLGLGEVEPLEDDPYCGFTDESVKKNLNSVQDGTDLSESDKEIISMVEDIIRSVEKLSQ